LYQKNIFSHSNETEKYQATTSTTNTTAATTSSATAAAAKTINNVT
jgi:hypothetical protein